MNMLPLSDDKIGHLENNAERKKYAFQFGQGIARLHKALKSVQDDVKPDEVNQYKQTLNVIPKMKEYSLKNNLGIDDEFFDDYIKTFGELFDKLPKHLIHGNPVGDSAVYNENGEVVCNKGFEIYNISHFILYASWWITSAHNVNRVKRAR